MRSVISLAILGALTLAVVSACGGNGNATESEIRAEQVLAMAPQGWNNVVRIRRVGEWRKEGTVLTAWSRVKLKNKPPRVDCTAVDTAQRIDNDDDISLALETVPDSYCEGTKPEP